MKSAYILSSTLLIYGCTNNLPNAWVDWSHEERIIYSAKTEFDPKKPILFFWDIQCPVSKVDTISNELKLAGYSVDMVYESWFPGKYVVKTEGKNIPPNLEIIRKYEAELEPIATNHGCDKPYLGASGHEK